MAGSVDLFLNINNSLNKNLAEAEGSMTGINDMSSKINKNMTEMTKNSDMLNDDYDDIEESSKNTASHTDKLAAGLKRALGFVGKIGAGFLAITGTFGIFDIVKGVLELNQQMTNLSYRSGEAGESIGQLEKAVTNTTKATGISLERSTEWITELKKLRVATADVEELATAGARFGQITGATDTSIQQLTGSLTTMGGLGAKAVTNVMRGIVGVQRAFGMTAGEVEGLNDSIVKSTASLRHMGRSSKDIEKFSIGVTKLAGAFVGVGMEVSDATQLIERMLDPGQIEDNAMLYAKLGISMQDAIEGNINPEKMIGGLKNLKSEMEGMNRIAANELAKSMGFTYDKIMQMSEIDLAKSMGAASDVSGDMAKEADQQAAAHRMMKESMEKIKVIFTDIALKAMPFINKAMKYVLNNVDSWIEKGKELFGGLKDMVAGPGGFKKIGFIIAGIAVAFVIALKLIKKRFFSVATDISKELSKTLTTGMVEGMEMGAEKGSEKARQIQKASVSAYAKDLEQRIIEGTEHAAMQSASTFYKAMAGTNLTKGAQALAQSTGEFLDDISKGAKPISLIDNYLKKSNEKMVEGMKLSREDAVARSEALSTHSKIHTSRLQELKTRQTLLQTAKEEGGLTADREAELKKINKMVTKQGAVVDKMTREQNKLDKRNEDQRVKGIKTLSKLQQTAMLEDLKNELKLAKLAEDKITAQKKQNELSIETLTNSKQAMSDQLINLQEIQKSEKSSVQQKSDAAEKLLQINVTYGEASKLLAQELEFQTSLAEQAKTSEKAIESTKDDLEKVLSATSKITIKQFEKLELEKEGFLNQKDLLIAAGKNTEEIDKQIRKVEELQSSGRDALDLGAMATGSGEKVKKLFETVQKGFTNGISQGLNKAGNSLRIVGKAISERFSPKNIRAKIAAAGDGNFMKGLGKIFSSGAKKMGSSMKSAGKKLGSVMKGAGGPLMLIMGLVLGALKDMDGFKAVLKKLSDAFKKVMGKLMPIIEETLLPIFMSLVDAILPLLPVIMEVLAPVLQIVGSVLEALLPIVLELVRLALPPLLMILGKLIQTIGKLGLFLMELPARIRGAIKKKSDEEIQADIDARKSKQFDEKAFQESKGWSRDLQRQLGSLMGQKAQADAGYGAELSFKQKTDLMALTAKRDIVFAQTDAARTTWEESDNGRSGFGKIYSVFESFESAGGDMVTAAEKLKNSMNGLGEIEESPEISFAGAVGGALEGITRKLYPAIIEATSTGFVKTEDAREEVSGSPEEIQKMLLEEQVATLKQISEALVEANYYAEVTATATTGTEEVISVKNIEPATR